MVMGDSAEENVEQLFRIHEENAQPRAAKHASIFAPKKYQLMHFYSPHSGDHPEYGFSDQDLEEMEDEADKEKYAPGPSLNLPGFRVCPASTEAAQVPGRHLRPQIELRSPCQSPCGQMLQATGHLTDSDI